MGLIPHQSNGPGTDNFAEKSLCIYDGYLAACVFNPKFNEQFSLILRFDNTMIYLPAVPPMFSTHVQNILALPVGYNPP